MADFQYTMLILHHYMALYMILLMPRILERFSLRKREQVSLGIWHFLDESRGVIGSHPVFMRELFTPMYATINSWLFRQVLNEKA